MISLGLCIGASNISFALLRSSEGQIHIIETKSLPHEGHPFNLLTKLYNKYKFNEIDRIAITGRKFRNLVNASTLSEPEAIEFAFKHEEPLNKNVNLIVSAGGETFMAYELDQKGRIIEAHTGNKCASGTGEFFLQQIKRMELSLDNVATIDDTTTSYKVSGRCSVFCKSDCTHALNKGTKKEEVVAGLCEMMGKKILELVKKSNYQNMLLIGGTSKNKKMVQHIKNHLHSVKISDFSHCYEALGAALWALENKTKKIENLNTFLNAKHTSFSFLPDLKEYKSKVSFKDASVSISQKDDQCILGLDVGSTTTKAVLIREKDNSIIASCYLRTNGDPITASRNCYSNLSKQLSHPIKIKGLGVTGSGRQIAGLHALTPSVMNEIIAHATASVYFDPEVDTIFEIGGQDAKYTYLTNGVPSDYAMNEACSAGTGSFLEESAKETLDIDLIDIEGRALKSSSPPNFSDQCAAFISSDIKSAIQEGISIDDITAGLVYSICTNYINRVKGNRPIGNKIFMQGGVCYNKAIPIAMAALTDKEIIVPPNPGLMGAFGAALEVKKQLELGLVASMDFNLEELSNREVTYKKPFVCAGGKDKCDRKCSINRIVIKNKTYPFGGACNKYDGIKDKEKDTFESLDLVAFREQLVYEKYSILFGKRLTKTRTNKKIGISKSLISNTLYPLFYNFFYSLGFDIVSPDYIDEEGIERKGSAFCYPVEISHGFISSLLSEQVDMFFLPHIKSLPITNCNEVTTTCPFVQAEPYYLQSAFKELNEKNVLKPVLDFNQDYNNQRNVFIDIGLKLGFKKTLIEKAIDRALEAQNSFHYECKLVGKKLLNELKDNPNDIGIVLFGRPYNAFTKYANMGIPHKFSTRNYRIIPHDFLSYENEEATDNMYWAMGQMILKAAQFVKKHPQLYGTFITNFSCGPDSFVINYFRNIMGKKPSLTLELDSHTADAGIDTRIEAFLDVVKSYRLLKEQKENFSRFQPARTITYNNQLFVIDSNAQTYPLNHPRVHVLIPSMGDIGSKLLAATFRHVGIKATAMPSSSEKEIKIGRKYSSCKECMPLMLTIGSLIRYLEERKDNDELLVYFMPDTSGPCRFGQYNILMKQVIEKQKIENVALFSLTSENSYAGLGNSFVLRAWQSVILADLLEDIYSGILVLSKDPVDGLYQYHKICNNIIYSVENDSWKKLKLTLEKATTTLQKLQKTQDISSAMKVGLVGEIFVRRDQFSRQHLVEKLAEKNIIVKVSPIAEWIYYCDYIVKNKIGTKATFKDQLRTKMQSVVKLQYEKTIKKIFSTSGLYDYHLVDVDYIINSVKKLISPRLQGEAILTIGVAITESIEAVDGIISIGPFGCMPSRISEALISDNIDKIKSKSTHDPLLVKKVQEAFPKLPFLPIEVDGNVLPQITEARLESFCLQVKRIHEEIIKNKRSTSSEEVI